MGSRPIASKYHEGKLKRTLKRKVKVLEIAEKEVSEAKMSLVRLLCAAAIACCASACVPASHAQAARCASYPVCQCYLARAEDFKGVEAASRCECSCVYSCVGCSESKWLHSTRLETRTKESNLYASLTMDKTCVRNESDG